MLETATNGLFGEQGEQQLFVQSVLIFAHGILADRLGAFRNTHPRINVALSTGNSVMDFANQFTDLQIVFGNPLQFGAMGDPLLAERLYPVARPDVAAEIQSPQDLFRFPLIEVATHRAGWPFVFAELKLLTGAARYVSADNTIIAAALAGSGAGIALARAPASDRVMQEAGLVPVLDGLIVEGQELYHLVYEDRTTLRPAAKAFRTWLLDQLYTERSNLVVR